MYLLRLNGPQAAADRLLGVKHRNDDGNRWFLHAHSPYMCARFAGRRPPHRIRPGGPVLRQTFDDEIITTEPLKNLYDELDKSKYEFDYLGEKKFDMVEKPVQLYKILYN